MQSMKSHKFLEKSIRVCDLDFNYFLDNQSLMFTGL